MCFLCFLFAFCAFVLLAPYWLFFVLSLRSCSSSCSVLFLSNRARTMVRRSSSSCDLVTYEKPIHLRLISSKHIEHTSLSFWASISISLMISIVSMISSFGRLSMVSVTPDGGIMDDNITEYPIKRAREIISTIRSELLSVEPANAITA